MKKKIFYLTFMLLCLFTFKMNTYAVSEHNLCGTVDWLQDTYSFTYSGTKTIPFYYGYRINCGTQIVELRIPYSLTISSPDVNKLDVTSIIAYIEVSDGSSVVRYYGEAKNGYFSFYVLGNSNLYLKNLTITVSSYSTNSVSFNFKISQFYQTYNVYNMDEVLNALNKIVASSNAGLTEAIQQQTQQAHQDSQATQEKIDETKQSVDKVNDSITDSDTSEANDSANSFFSGFESDDFGLSSIITTPLNFIKSITSSTCNSIGFNAPFVNQRVTLPCMSSIYEQYFGNFLTIYQTITFGMIAYWVCINTFAIVKGFKDPDSDRIEVVDL